MVVALLQNKLMHVYQAGVIPCHYLPRDLVVFINNYKLIVPVNSCDCP